MTCKIVVGDCLASLRAMADQSVNTCVTSPPYFGLRDYGHAGQIGLEQTPDEFVAKLVEVFREVRRVLRDDGTLWLNLGDSYAAQRSGTAMPAETLAGGQSGQSVDGRGHRGRGDADATRVDGGTRRAAGSGPAHRNASAIGLKHKDLIGIPWRVAFALQADGWTLRQDIIWHKPNPMPESVKDRCTKAHEYIFLLSKGPRYYFDSEAMKEPAIYPAGTKAAKGSATRAAQPGVNSRPPEYKVYDGMRNRRSVWTVTTKPFKGAHFATFPPDLIEPCVLAGCPEGGTVLDPFGGAGTTGLVAARNNRNSILCELNPEYAAMAAERVRSA
jgi:site-specific DNA-methyltransferase (adenine-specific)